MRFAQWRCGPDGRTCRLILSLHLPRSRRRQLLACGDGGGSSAWRRAAMTRLPLTARRMQLAQREPRPAQSTLLLPRMLMRLCTCKQRRRRRLPLPPKQHKPLPLRRRLRASELRRRQLQLKRRHRQLKEPLLLLRRMLRQQRNGKSLRRLPPQRLLLKRRTHSCKPSNSLRLLPWKPRRRRLS